MLADALGRPLRFIVTAGQVGDAPQAPALLDGQIGDAVLADKAYDSNALREIIADLGARAVIPSNRTRKIIIPHDTTAYKQRNRIERCFCRLKQANHPLHRLHTSRSRNDLDAMIVDPS
jgi:transposase